MFPDQEPEKPPKPPCPHCGGSDSHVTHTRPVPRGIRRYRKCELPECARTFTTMEVTEKYRAA